MKFQEVFKRLNGREAGAEDVLKFERLTTALETTPNDAMLAVLVALDHYETLYGTIPAKIRKESESTLASFKLAAEKTATAAFKTSEAAHADALVQLADKVAIQASTKSMFKWAACCITAVVAILVPALLYTHSTGIEAGKGLGYTEAKDEKAAAAWANTPEGKLAYRFAQTGSIANLAKCDRPGWYIEKGVCYVKPASDGTYGWRLP
ncbi:protein mobE [Rhodoferax antarcticus]|uniref:protein mobE n=1 Tax=Rhodoferax antarcticus TaxID=81479 RepID=UPI0022244439|nr:protein mobE [Rhodoferax antarcticus]MCW2314065.1 hypothetical protein [Rhodoferax antarcticus]